MALSDSALSTLLEKANNYNASLADNIYYESIFANNNFGLINSYIAFTAFQQERNIYIRTCNLDSALQLALPILYPIAIKILLENADLYHPHFEEVAEDNYFVNKKNIYEVGYRDSKPCLIGNVKNGYSYINIPNDTALLNTYYLVPKNSKANKNIIKSLNHYELVFNSITTNPYKSIRKPPSLFTKKIMVVGTKSYLEEKIKQNSFLSSFPIAFIINNEEDNYQLDTELPLDPMILITHKYQTAFKYIEKYYKESKFEYFLLIDSNKENNISAKIKNFCANGFVKNFGFIGNEIIKNDNTMLLWNWGNIEEMKIKGKYGIKFDYSFSLEESTELTQEINKYIEILKNMADEFEEISKDLYCFATRGLKKILDDKLFKITDIDSEIINYMFQKMSDILLSNYYETEDFEKYYKELKNILYNIFNLLRSTPGIKQKLQLMNEKKVYLVVENSRYDEWKNSLSDFDNVYLFSFRDLLKDLKSKNSKDLYWLTFIPDEKKLLQLYNTLVDQEVSIHLLLHPSEIRIFTAKQKNINKYTSNKHEIKDTSLFPEIESEVQEKESLDDLISRFEDNFEDTINNFDYESNCYSSYKISVLDIDENKKNIIVPLTILRDNGSEINLVTVDSLLPGDNIFVYDSKDKKSLYEILSEKSEKIKDVNYYSRLWKDRLKKYLNYKIVDSSENESYYNIEKIWNLANYLGIKPDYILKNWLNNTDQVRFPQKSILEKLLVILKNNYLLNSEEEREIKSARKFFVGIMISLGLNLSSELQNIMLGEKDSKENFIKENVIGNPNQFPLLYRLDWESILGIIGYNFVKYKFIEILNREEID